MIDFDTQIALFLERLGIWTYPLKFYVWGRKIEEMVRYYEINEPEGLMPYLKKVKYLRKKWCIKEPKIYTKKVNQLFQKYQI